MIGAESGWIEDAARILNWAAELAELSVTQLLRNTGRGSVYLM
jgi:hypothetical protein